MQPFLEGWLYVPVNLINNLELLKQKLTVKSKYKDPETGDEKPEIFVYDDKSYEGYIGLPPRFGLDNFSHLEIIDRTSAGDFELVVKKEPDLDHPNAHPQQKFIFPEILNSVKTKKYSLLEADTGVGKTVMALKVAASLGMRTLIIVNKNRLRLQWIEEIKTHLGLDEKDIGVIQGGKCEVDKPISIAMLQTLYKGKYREAMHNKFGFAVFDEVHNLSAPEFSKALGTINPCNMLAMSATTKRKDGTHLVYNLHFGNVEVSASADALPLKVIIIPYERDTSKPWIGENWGQDRNGKILCISRDTNRTKLIAKLLYKGIQSGRNIVVFSEYKKHLKNIFDETVKLGADPEVFGHFYNDGEKLQISANPMKRKQYHDYICANAQVLLATYGMMKEGISINRLDMGIDATPIASAKQVIGRIRRPFPNKKMPVWYTINDIDDPILSNFCKARKKEYIADNTVELIEYGK